MIFLFPPGILWTMDSIVLFLFRANRLPWCLLRVGVLLNVPFVLHTCFTIANETCVLSNRLSHEVEDIINNYGINHIFFIDDTFTIGEKRVIALCKLLREKNLNIEWICLGRVDTVTEPMLAAMKRAGCKEIIYGIESASPAVLATTKKNITLEQMERAVRVTKKLGIRVSLFFMFGNPGDTLESIRETSRLARKLNPNFASFNIATPDPGTPLFETVKDQLCY